MGIFTRKDLQNTFSFTLNEEIIDPLVDVHP